MLCYMYSGKRRHALSALKESTLRHVLCVIAEEDLLLLELPQSHAHASVIGIVLLKLLSTPSSSINIIATTTVDNSD
jgi:hypothetical protein